MHHVVNFLQQAERGRRPSRERVCQPTVGTALKKGEKRRARKKRRKDGKGKGIKHRSFPKCFVKRREKKGVQGSSGKVAIKRSRVKGREIRKVKARGKGTTAG